MLHDETAVLCESSPQRCRRSDFQSDVRLKRCCKYDQTEIGGSRGRKGFTADKKWSTLGRLERKIDHGTSP
jgi:hypothetical protein